ncbi:MAG: LysR substrate-binding domain-containing protein, partial [Pseudomonadota bacterium]|nr:LysR substrate-binding domain-containing protein [Pseudomonadota bacterium]
LRFLRKTDKESTSLRDGTVDLETGVVGNAAGPELRSRALFGDRLVGVVRIGHPLAQGEITPSRYAQGCHIAVSRRGLARGPVDEALHPFGLERQVVTIVDSFSSALALARAAELVATVPERHTASLRAGMVSFSLPVATPAMTISMLWHPRMDGDAAHRWLRGLMLDACAAP